jgi:hypothetical protein
VLSQPGAWVAMICLVIAAIGWYRSGDPIRHETPIIAGILVYFGIGTLDIVLALSEWSPRYSVTSRVWSIVGAGVLAYLIGGWLGRRRPTALPDAQPGETERAEQSGRVLSRIGWVGIALLLYITRAPLLTGANRESSSGYLTNLALIIIPAFLLRFAARRGRLTRTDYGLLGLAAFLLLVTGYRTYTLVLGLSAGTLLLLDAASRRQRLRIAGAILALGMTVGVGFGYWRFTREGNESGDQLVSLVVGQNDPNLVRLAAAYTFIGLFREGPALLGFLVERYPGLTPHTGGAALTGMLTSPLPGEQWDARAIISQDLYGTRQTSLVSTVFGPWYLDFGVGGVIVALGLMGFLLSRIERRALTRGDPYARAGYAYGLVLMALTIHTGLSDFAFAVLIPLLFVWAATRLGAAPEQEPQGPQ